jgi:hypothetical protein
MGRTATDLIVIALAVIAVAQLALAIGLTVAVLRLLKEIHTLHLRLERTLTDLETTLRHISGLAETAGGTVAAAQRLASHASVLAGVGRAAAESFIGKAVLRKVLPNAVSGAADAVGVGSGTAVKVAMGIGVAAWRFMAARRARRRAAQPVLLESAAAGADGTAAANGAARVLPAAVRRGPGVGRVKALRPEARAAKPASGAGSPAAAEDGAAIDAEGPTPPTP